VRPIANSLVFVSLRPENISITVKDGAAGSGWEGVVDQRAVDHIVRVSGTEIRVRTNRAMSLPEGAEVSLGFAPNAAVVMTREAA